MEVIGHSEAIGRHFAAILRIMQRMPILFCLDGFLRTRLITGNLPIYAGLFLLLLSNQCLTSVYSVVVCFLFMLLSVPDFLIDYVQKFWISISINQNFYSAWYLEVAFVFFICALTVTILRHINAYMCNPHISCEWYATGFIVLGRFLGSEQFDIFEFPLLLNTCLLVYQLVFFILIYDVFRLDKYVYCGLIYLYYNTVPGMWRPRHPIIVWIIIILAWLTIHRKEHPTNGAFESLKVYVTRFRLTFESLKDMFIAAFLPYAIFLSIGLPCVLYKNNITQPVTVLVQVVTIMSNTILGTIAYIVLVTYICYGCIILTVWFLHGRNKGPEISKPISPGIILIVLEIQLFHIEPLMHGWLMYFAILLIGPTLLLDIHKVSEPILLEHCTSGANLIKQTKTISLFLFLIVFPMFVLLKFHQLELHHLGIFWAIVVTLSWVTVCIEALGTIAVYCLLVYDNIKSEPFKNLDGGMYCIKAIVCLVEISAGVLNICYLTWNITAIQWSWIGFVILGCCLLNTYQRVNDGWNEFQRRRWTVKRLAFLPNATLTQLKENDDVCAICLRNMSTAKITPCNHFFHESCLRKWSYVRKTCPCCNKVINVD